MMSYCYNEVKCNCCMQVDLTLYFEQIMTQKWVEKSVTSGMIIERQIGPAVKIKLVSFENAIEFIKLVPPVEQKQTKLKFVEMIRRYLEGDHSLLKEDYEPDGLADPMAVGCWIPKRKRDEVKVVDDNSAQLQAIHNAREADLTFVTKAANGLKEICGGQLDEDAKQALKAKMFKLLERD
jgi:hypothetical protein